MRLLLIIISYTLFFSCSSNLDFKHSVEIIPIKVQLPDSVYFSSPQIFPIKNGLIIFDKQFGKNFGGFFSYSQNLDSLHLEFTFLPIGEAEGEFSGIGKFYLNEMSKQLLIYDANKMLIYSLFLPNIKNWKNESPTVKYRIPNREFFIGDFAINQSQQIVARNFDSPFMLFSFDNEGIVNESNEKYIFNDESLVGLDPFNQYFYSFIKHPIKDIFLCQYTAYDRISLLDENLQLSKVISGPLGVSYNKQKEVIDTYRWGKSTEKGGYFLYVGQSPNYSNYSIPSGEFIHLISWDGDKMINIRSTIPIINFAPDPQNRVIWALIDDKEGSFVKLPFDESNY